MRRTSMPKISQWRKILGHTEKPKVRVQVSGKAEVMTDTQSIRFEELTQKRDAGKPAVARNPLEESTYGLEDASFRLMITEDQLLQKAAAGSIDLYVDAAGLPGHWQHDEAASEILQTPAKMLKSGLLALDQKSCQELAVTGITRVSTLDFRSAADPTALNIDPDTLATLLTWGSGNRRFCLSKPVQVSRGDVLLLSPLVFSG